MTQLAIDIPQVTVRVLKAQRTLAGDAVEADRIDGVASGDMPRLLVFWREEGEDVSGGSGPPAFAMELTLVVQALVERAARDDAVRDLDTMILQTQLALLEDPEWNRLAAIGSMRVARVQGRRATDPRRRPHRVRDALARKLPDTGLVR